MDAPPRQGSTAYWKRHKLVKKRERQVFKNVLNPDNFEMVMSNHYDMKIVEAISAAINSAKEIVRREHIKADRIERVQHFVVCLRRHIGYKIDSSIIKNNYVTALCDKALWYDIGIPNGTPDGNKPSGWHQSYVTIEQVHKWATEARVHAGSASASGLTLQADIERDIKNLDASLAVMDTIIAEAQTINAEGEKIIAKMVDVAEELAGT